MRLGFRIVKPRTERQQEAASEYSQRPDSVVSIAKADAGIPRSSWWADSLSREDFDRRVAEEQPRILTSRFALTRQSFVLD